MINKIKKKINKKRRKKEAKACEKRRIQFVESTIARLFPFLKIANGPFRGMQYPEAISVGSRLFPKLLGSYESELSGVLEDIIGRGYTEIVDIGCAEGYYTVGLGMCIPSAEIYAYDVNGEALRLCHDMALHNGISEGRIHFGAKCSSDTIQHLPLAKKALFICDCEGYEKELFTPDLIPHLERHDLLIETHDCYDVTISTQLENLFQSTHEITNILSVDDIQKAKTYTYPQLDGFSLEERYILLSEGRPSIMEWLYIKSKRD
ncbi:MAG: hypothetical protein ACPHYF_06140 [Akkermansiaceae bacterium]